MATPTCPHCGLPLENLAIEQQYRGWSYFNVNRTDDGVFFVDWENVDDSPEIEFVGNARRLIHLDCFSFVDEASLMADGTLAITPAPNDHLVSFGPGRNSTQPRRHARAMLAAQARRNRASVRTPRRARLRSRQRPVFIEAA